MKKYKRSKVFGLGVINLCRVDWWNGHWHSWPLLRVAPTSAYWGQPLWILRQSLPQENHNFPRLIDIAVAQCQNTCMCPWQRKRMAVKGYVNFASSFLFAHTERAYRRIKGRIQVLFDPGMVPRWIRIRIRIRPQHNRDAGWRPELVRRNAWKKTLSRIQQTLERSIIKSDQQFSIHPLQFFFWNYVG